MSDFCYHVLALTPTGSEFTVEDAVEAFVADGQSASVVTSPGGARDGFRVVFADDWAIVAWLEDDADVAAESEEILDVFGRPPGAPPDGPPITCDRRLSIWSDDDSEMMNAHFFEETIQFLQERFRLFVFDGNLGIWR
jgi:hypothetical protein